MIVEEIIYNDVIANFKYLVYYLGGRGMIDIMFIIVMILLILLISIHICEKILHSPNKRIEVRKSSDGQYYWVIIGKNGKDMGCSEMIRNKKDCMKSVTSIMKTKWINSDLKDMTNKADV